MVVSMDLHTYWSRLDPEGRKAFASRAKTSVQVVWNHLSPQVKQPGPHLAVRMEQASEGAVSRIDLRPDDWQEYWPELERREEPRPAKKKKAGA